MASLIPGFEYDIFISYRQKDNKQDGWVTKFVTDLKGELESTFKEEVSVYFDVNPHDGLLPTHDVDETLKEKLKCLIFIPVISRTYCDAKSFAWEHEFKAFIKQATDDRYGLKIRTLGGNIASRILPVQIHELDASDKRTIEYELGGPIRGIEFIYKEPGVNKPLSSDDDDKRNLNNTRYRIQINKMANAISEVLRGIMQSGEEVEENQDVIHVTPEKKRRTNVKVKSLMITAGSFVTVLGMLAIFMFTSGSTLPFSKRDWIVISDFENLTTDTLFDKSLYTAFTLSISQSRYVNVIPRTRLFENLSRMKIDQQNRIDEKLGREIAIREGITILIVPGISQVGEKYAVTAKITEAGSGNLLKSEIYYSENKDGILESLDQLARQVRKDLGESRYDIINQDKPLAKVTTSSLEALRFYSHGLDQHSLQNFEEARDLYAKALKIDTGFTAAKASLGNINIEKFDPVEGQKLLTQAVRSVDKLTDRERLGILAFHAVNVEKNIPKGIEYTRIRADLYPDDVAARSNLGWYYQNLGEYEKSIAEYKEAIRIDPHMALPYGGLMWTYLEKLGDRDSALTWSRRMIKNIPDNAWGYFYLGTAYTCFDSLDRSVTEFAKAYEINSYFTLNMYRWAYSLRLLESYSESNKVLERISAINKNDISVYYEIALNLSLMNDNLEAEKYFTLFKNKVTETWLKHFPDKAETYISLSASEARLNNLVASEGYLKKAMSLDTTLHIKYAGLFAVQGKIPQAIGEAEKAMKSGYRDIYWLKAGPDLMALQNDIRYHHLIEKYFKIKP